MNYSISRMSHICCIQSLQIRINNQSDSYELLNTRTDTELLDLRDNLVIKYNKAIKKEKLITDDLK